MSTETILEHLNKDIEDLKKNLAELQIRVILKNLENDILPIPHEVFNIFNLSSGYNSELSSQILLLIKQL